MITFLGVVAVFLLVVLNAWLEKRDVNLLAVIITLFVAGIFYLGVTQ